MEVIALALGIVFMGTVVAIAVAKMIFPTPDYSGFAKSLRRLKDETESYGGDFRPLASLAKSVTEDKK